MYQDSEQNTLEQMASTVIVTVPFVKMREPCFENCKALSLDLKADDRQLP